MQLSTKRARKPNFTDGEVMCLMELYSENKAVLNSKLTNSVTNRRKTEIWKKISSVLNSRNNGVGYDVEELRKKWKDLYTRAKQDLSAHKAPATGGGPQHKDSPYTAWVLDIVGPDSTSLIGVEEGTETGMDFITAVPCFQTSVFSTSHSASASASASASPSPSTSTAVQPTVTTFQEQPVAVQETRSSCPVLPQKRKSDTSVESDELYRQLLTREIERAEAETERARVETEKARAELDKIKLEKQKIQLEIKLFEAKLEHPDYFTIPIQTISES